MQMTENQLILYGEFEDGYFQNCGSIFHKMTQVIRESSRGNILKLEVYEALKELVRWAYEYGFYGNLWHCYLTFLLVNCENPFSRACESEEEISESLCSLALHDFAVIQSYFEFDFTVFSGEFPTVLFETVQDYKEQQKTSRIYDKRIKDQIYKLSLSLVQADNPFIFKEALADFYKEYGLGKFGMHKAFRVLREKGTIEIKPIINIEKVYLTDLIGYEMPKQQLVANTEAFVEGKPANNCLLFGDAGTGKSSSIKGILQEYYDRGLRIIEIYKHQFQYLNDVISMIKDYNYKFIIYMDDLSFEDFETEYKYLKAIIEGGIEARPQNVLIYATSNRRHLIRESFNDKKDRDEELHTNDTVQEKLSLAARFGLNIFFCAPDQKEFQNIVKILAARHNISMTEEELLLEANRWELSHSGLSGRTAQQFVDYLSGKQ